MIYSIFPSKDTTIYEANKPLNAGVDEILELTKIVSSSLAPGLSNTRILMNFDTTEISQSVVDGIIPSGSQAQYWFRMYNVVQEQVPSSYDITVNPLSQSWSNGIGKALYTPAVLEGASWIYTDGATSGTQWTTQGGTTQSGFECTQSFTNQSGDVLLDVTTMVTNSWDEPESDRYGILIQRTPSQELDDKRYGSLKFFSNETHTIYPPRLEVRWDDSSFSTSGLTQITSIGDIDITLTNLREEYNEKSKTRISIDAREIYASKTYATSSAGYTKQFLPTTTYYSIIDAQTGEVVIDYNTSFTKISCDSNGNYINIWMNGLLPERYYNINIKAVDRMYSGSVEYFSPSQTFKVIR